jgi:hypothetical protein
MKTIRVFPQRTKATPIDDLAYVGLPSMFAEADKIEISVSFTWDIPEAERLEKEWRHVAPTTIGGPAFNNPGGDFIPGQYIKRGYVITSRGCNNRCWFCSVWKREGGVVRELPITEGWNVLDDNLLACSESHIRAVFSMLEKQKERIQFTGGLEAKLLKPWHVDLLHSLKPKQMFFAYDTPDDLEPLIEVGRMLKTAGFTRNHMRCYVLIGYPKDTLEDAEKRLITTIQHGYFPMAMLWKDKNGMTNYDWRKFQRLWARPAIIAKKSEEK